MTSSDNLNYEAQVRLHSAQSQDFQQVGAIKIESSNFLELSRHFNVVYYRQQFTWLFFLSFVHKHTIPRSIKVPVPVVGFPSMHSPHLTRLEFAAVPRAL